MCTYLCLNIDLFEAPYGIHIISTVFFSSQLYKYLPINQANKNF